MAWTLADALRAEARARGLRYAATAIPGCGMLTGQPSAGPDAGPVTWAAGCEPLLVNNEQALAARKNGGTVVAERVRRPATVRVTATRGLNCSAPSETDAVLLDLMEQSRGPDPRGDETRCWSW